MHRCMLTANHVTCVACAGMHDLGRPMHGYTRHVPLLICYVPTKCLTPSHMHLHVCSYPTPARKLCEDASSTRSYVPTNRLTLCRFVLYCNADALCMQNPRSMLLCRHAGLCCTVTPTCYGSKMLWTTPRSACATAAVCSPRATLCGTHALGRTRTARRQTL